MSDEDDTRVAALASDTTAAAALGLRLSGADFSAIAQVLHLASWREARVLVERALADSVTTKDVNAERTLQVRRIEQLLRSVWPTANNPKNKEHARYFQLALEAIALSSKIQGLYAPAQVQVTHTPDYEMVQEWVASMASGIRGEPISVEADILQIEGL